MAITIMGGLLVATILTLLVVPALYALWFRVTKDEAFMKSSKNSIIEAKAARFAA
jgi:hypothetical protein